LLVEGEFHDAVPAAKEVMNLAPPKVASHVLRALVRHSLLIQLVNEGNTTTLSEVRWTFRLAGDDPRRASVEDCLELLQRGAELALAAASTAEGLEAITGLALLSKVPNEIPLDYADRHANPLHTAANVRWLDNDFAAHLARQRLILLNPLQNPEHAVFAAAYEKIKVKTYQTDRVQTGRHQTNREYRWETHPESVHFALRQDCMSIERALIDQLCRLDGMPEELEGMLVEQGLLVADAPKTRCPVTLDLLAWDDFANEMLEPDHGRSAFQVGHLNPLKAVNDDPTWGHTAANVAWISQDGNRIQGHLSLAQARALLDRVRRNYEELEPALEG
jgi:hypothetical protein